MKRSLFIATLLVLPAIAVSAQQSPGLLAQVRNARFVYVTTYDGSSFSENPTLEDRAAASAVQDALRQFGPLTVVSQPQQADMIVVVECRPSEDILAVYSPRDWPRGDFLWRAMGKGGLSAPALPLLQQLEAALQKVYGKKPV
jgi:hypothetical protein